MENINNDEVMRYHQSPQKETTFDYIMQKEKQQLQNLWSEQMQEIQGMKDFKTHQKFPLTRIKKIMKYDPDVKMIAAEAPFLLAKACEMFTLELTMRSWLHTEENNRRMFLRSDVAAAISRTLPFDFLVDVVTKEESLGTDQGFKAKPLPPDGGVPCDYPSGMVIGTPVVDGNVMYSTQPQQGYWPGAWTAAADEAGPSGGNGGGK